MSVIGAVDGQLTLQSPGYGAPAEKSRKVEKDTASMSKSKSSANKPLKSSVKKPVQASSTDTKIAELDQKWSDQFNRLEALLMARTLNREPTFQTVKVAPTHSPPAGSVRSTEPFIKLAERPSTLSTPSSTELPGTDSSAAKHQSGTKTHTGQPHSDRPRTSDVSDPPVLHR